MVFYPDKNGYIKDWLISGPAESPVEWREDNSQYEHLPFVNSFIFWRKDEMDNAAAMYQHQDSQIDISSISLGATSPLGLQWKYYRGGECNLVRDNKYYFQICRLEMYAYTQIESPSDREIEIKLYSHAATEIWINAEKFTLSDTIDYRPLKVMSKSVKLQKGINTVFVRHQNAGIRDTRVIFGVRLAGNIEGLSIALPGEDTMFEEVNSLSGFLEGVRMYKNILEAPMMPPLPLKVECNGSVLQWGADTTFHLPEHCETVKLSANVHGYPCSRILYQWENIIPVFDYDGLKGKAREEKIISHFIQNKKKGGGHGGIYYALPAFALGIQGEDEQVLIREAIEYMKERNDCSEFSLSGLLRIYNSYPLDEKTKEEIKKAALGFRYWVDEEGTDAMCMNSENHRALFYGCQAITGRLFPDETFSASGRTGLEQYKIGLERCRRLVEHFEKNGFAEFTSGAYVPITLVALLNMHDFAGDEELTRRCAALIDRIIYQSAIHTLHGVCAPPMGRIYRDVTEPFNTGIQALLYYITDRSAVAFSQYFNAFVSSAYKIPDNVEQLMTEDISMNYMNGGAEIALCKTEQYMLSTVQVNGTDNERGIIAGAYGYQEHLFYAVLEGGTIVFANHPGEQYFESPHRPGYWYGNGVFPAITQKDNAAGLIFSSQDKYPVHFAHVFYPSYQFEEELADGNWRFVRKGSSYLALWSSTELVPYDNVVCGCELRSERDCTAFLFILSGEQESGAWDAFIEKARQSRPKFDESSLTLTSSLLQLQYNTRKYKDF